MAVTMVVVEVAAAAASVMFYNLRDIKYVYYSMFIHRLISPESL